MAAQSCLHHLKLVAQFSGDGGEGSRRPSEQFAPLASAFRRRLLVGVGTASLVALGADFCGCTSFLLGLAPEAGRSLKLDVLYPIGGYRRCVDATDGFEFVYPAKWVGDQTLLYRAVGRAEMERSLDPPSISDPLLRNRRRRNLNEPVVAFGPPGSTGELNVSVIVSPVPLDFSIEAFGGPREVGEAIVRTITGKRAGVTGTLIESTLREDAMNYVKYYLLEFKVESSTFRRHNVAVCCVRQGKLFTLNAQAPESAWLDVRRDLYSIANSFSLTT
ncbi:hypothetical protein QQ045_022775 [Rhodiola kirilowii]